MPDQNLLMRYSPQMIEGPFTDVLTKPRVQVEPVSGYASPAVGAGTVALKFLEGASQARMQKFQQEENRRVQAYQNVLHDAQSQLENPNLTQEAKDAIQETISKAYADAFLAESKGPASKHPIVNILRQIATGATGGEMPSRGKAGDILQTWSELRTKLNTPQYTKEGLYQQTKAQSDVVMAQLKEQYKDQGGIVPPWVIQEKVLPIGMKLQAEAPDRYQAWVGGLVGPSFQQQLGYQMSVEAAQEMAPPHNRQAIHPPAGPAHYVPERPPATPMVGPREVPGPMPVAVSPVTASPPDTRQELDISNPLAPPIGGPIPFGLGVGVAEAQPATTTPPTSNAPTVVPEPGEKPTTVIDQAMQWRKQVDDIVSSPLKANTPVGVFTRNAFSVSMAPPIAEAKVPTIGDSPSLYFKYRHTKAIQDVYGGPEEGVLASPDGTRYIPATFDKRKGKWVNTGTGQAYTDDVQRDWTFQKQATHPQGSWQETDPQPDSEGKLRPTFVNAANGKTITFTGLEATDKALANRNLQSFMNLSQWFNQSRMTLATQHFDELRKIEDKWGALPGLEVYKNQRLSQERARASQQDRTLYNIHNEALQRIGLGNMKYPYVDLWGTQDQSGGTPRGGGSGGGGPVAMSRIQENNPGALKGTSGFLKYPTWEEGVKAHEQLLLGYIGGKFNLGPNATIAQMGQVYAPPTENDTPVWIDNVVSNLQKAGMSDASPATKLDQFKDPNKRRMLMQSIWRAEGTYPGHVLWARRRGEKWATEASLPKELEGMLPQTQSPPPTKAQVQERSRVAAKGLGLE